MTPVTQRVFAAKARGDGHNALGIAGDCWRAALASVLDLPYHDVPHFVNYSDCRHPNDQERDDPLTEEHGGLWWRRARRFMRARGQDLACYYEDDGSITPLPGVDGSGWEGWVIAGGPSPRGDFGHACVGYYSWRDGKPHVDVIHDPHPSRAGLRSVEDIYVVVAPYDPAPPVEAVEGVAA